MTEREQFEKAFPVPKGMAYAEKYNAYMRSGGDLETPKAIYYNESWQAWEAARATPEPIGDPTEEMVLAGIAAANRQMPYINDAQKVLAIWKAMQPRATPALPQVVEEWVEKNAEYSDRVYECHAKYRSMKKYVAVDDLMNLLSGMAIVPVYDLEVILEDVRDRLHKAYQSATPVCCGRRGQECCGNPDPEWSAEDSAVMDALGPIEKRITTLISAHTATASQKESEHG